MLLCIQCKDHQKTCCQSNVRINLTQGDVRRIMLAKGNKDFFALFPCPDLSEIDTSKDDYDPNWLRYITLPENFHRLLKMNEGGACVFLGERGCELAEDDRPLACRMYPYNFNEFGMIGLLYPDEMWCPVHLLNRGEDLVERLGMSLEKVKQWRLLYYDELRAEYNERK